MLPSSGERKNLTSPVGGVTRFLLLTWRYTVVDELSSVEEEWDPETKSAGDEAHGRDAQGGPHKALADGEKEKDTAAGLAKGKRSP